MKTIQIQLQPSDVGRLLASNKEYPDTFVISGDIVGGLVVLEHHIDGVPSTLRLYLHPGGTWTAFKDIEV